MNKITVEIFGHPYILKGGADEAYAKSLAAFVDQKMNEMAGHSKGVQPVRLAILAAINITHELFQIRNNQKEKETYLSEKTQDLIDSIEEQFEELKLD